MTPWINMNLIQIEIRGNLNSFLNVFGQCMTVSGT